MLEKLKLVQQSHYPQVREALLLKVRKKTKENVHVQEKYFGKMFS